MQLNRFPLPPADEQVLSDRVVGLEPAGSPHENFQAGLGPFSQVSAGHQAVHPPPHRFDQFLYPKARHRRDVSRHGGGADVPSDVQRVEVGEVSDRQSLADEECVLDAFPSAGSQQQRDDSHGTLGASVQDDGLLAPIPFDTAGFDKHSLTLSQQAFVERVEDWCRSPRKLLLVVSGGPGTGKSYCIREILSHVQVKQLRMSYTAVSAEAIRGRTIHSTVNLAYGKNSLSGTLEAQLKDETDLLKCIEESRDIVGEFTYSGHPQIVVVDEVSMINGWLMYWLVRFFMDRTNEPLLFVALGDRHQLNPVKSIHNLFSVMSWGGEMEVRKIELKESRRFKPEYEAIINQLRGHVDRDDRKGFLECVRQHFPVVEDIHSKLLRRANRAMAFLNKRVRKFNTHYIEKMVEGPKTELNNGDLVLKPGCLVYVTKNGHSSAKNGTLLVFERYDAAKKCVLCRYPDSKKVVLVSESEPGKFPLDLGFASTVHKFQGSTLNSNIVIHFDNFLDLNLVYTALSRVRCMDQIIAISGLQEEGLPEEET